MIDGLLIIAAAAVSSGFAKVIAEVIAALAIIAVIAVKVIGR